MSAVMQALKDRCLSAGLRAELVEATPDPPLSRRLRIWYGDEPESERLVIRESIAEFVAGSRFDAFQPLLDFEGVWSPSEGVIECELDTGGVGAPTRFVLAIIARGVGLDDDAAFRAEDVAGAIIPIPLKHDTIKAAIRLGSDEFTVWRGLFHPHAALEFDRRPRRVVLRIEGMHATAAEAAADILERISNSILFQLDLHTDVPVFLARRREFFDRRPRRSPAPGVMSAPAFQYDNEPMALYWYARTSQQVPLLSFLAFYQVLEFYFPVFSAERAHATLRNLLKDPRFDVANDLHIARLVQAIRPNASGRGFGDERAQLQATIQACVTPLQMSEFFRSDDRLFKFYDRHGKQRMPIVETKLPVSTDSDLRPLVAQRVYDIRNRIVHTKSGEPGSEVLLPFSRESRLLRFDIQLIQYLARQALIATSNPLRL
jgi:hypothetical protein